MASTPSESPSVSNYLRPSRQYPHQWSPNLIVTGYWAFKKYQQDPYILDAQQDHLDTALDWARQTGLKVWIDLHGAPLSQNGFDNSGQRVDSPGWTNGDSVAHTQTVIEQLATKYAAPALADVVVGIELLNEPLMGSLPGGRAATQQYYQSGFDAVRGVGGSTAMVVIQDGFANPPAWNGFLTGEGARGAVVDHHEYQVFTNALVALSPQQHADAVCGSAQAWGTGADKFIVVGEFTGAMTDCAPALVSISCPLLFLCTTLSLSGLPLGEIFFLLP